jgi:pyruvate formate lyase activating enzyme
MTPAVERLIEVADMFLLDIKMTTEEDYKRYMGGSLAATVAFLDRLEQMQKDVWIRHVVVPGINDTEEDLLRLAELTKGYTCIKKVELLPFKNLCLEKYKALNIPFPLEATPPMRAEEIAKLEKVLESVL